MKRIKAFLFSNQLIAGSLVMFVGTMVVNVGSYLYHLLMGRMLGPVDYGILASLISLLYLLNIPIGTLNLVIVKFVSKFKGEKRLEAVSHLFKFLRQKMFFYGLAALLAFLILMPFLASFLHLDSLLPLFIVGVFAFITIITMVNRATLQGLLRFGYLSASNIIEIVLKVGLAILLVAMGLKVNGALFPFIIGGIFAYFFTFFALRFLPETGDKIKSLNGQEMLCFAIPVFFFTLSSTSLYTNDIILVRHFLDAQQAGFYAALATLGKVIFFASSPIIFVMFPMVSERYANGGKYKPILFSSGALIGAICLGVSGIYFIFPALMIKLLFGNAYLPAVPYLGLFGIFISLYTLSSLLVNFYLSIGKTLAVLLPMVAAILQIILIFLFHQNIGQIIWISIGVTALLLFSLLLSYLKNEKA